MRLLTPALSSAEEEREKTSEGMQLLTPAQFGFSVPRGSARSSAEEEREADSDGADVSDVSCGRSAQPLRARRSTLFNRRSNTVGTLFGCAGGGISPAGCKLDGR